MLDGTGEPGAGPDGAAGEAVGAAGQGARGPHEAARRAGGDLVVDAVAAVLAGVVGAAAADTAALRESAVDQGALRVGVAQGPDQTGGLPGEQLGDLVDVGMGGVGADPEAGRDLGGRVVLAQVHERNQGSRGGPQLASALPSRVTISIVTREGSACGRSSAAGKVTDEASRRNS
ncbi:hypothetical protein Kpho02_05390 [Kitasatospora phosalacinea]|uniref:Uncharacterized protein n=1 Tax=Kitasatospora phosalacinea TaxID=2065 RepID=A0A9W6V0V3_9ACTN|nr:hypothetical protein Kpho02_05390 [Kitasatospora phosalacinea]